MSKKRQKRKKLLKFQRSQMAKEFGEARCPLITNANIRSLHLSRCPYVDIGRGQIIVVAYLFGRSVSEFRTCAMVTNRMTCCYPVAP